MNDLTPIEVDILKWVSLGKRNADIAELMGVNVRILDQRIIKIKDKLGTPTLAGAVAICLRTGIFS